MPDDPRTCRNCIWATFGPWDNSEMQDGCSLGRIKKFQQAGAVETRDGPYYQLSRICNAKRNDTWKESHEGKNLHQLVRDEIRIKCDFIILECDTNANVKTIYDKLKTTLDSISQSKIKPVSTKLVILRNHNGYRLAGKPNVPEIVQNFDEDQSIERSIDLAAKRCTSTYYGVFFNGETIPPNYLSTVDNLINEELKQINMMLPYDGEWSGLIVQTTLHRWLNGNYSDGNWNVKSKIKYLAEDQGNDEAIWSGAVEWK